MSEITNENKSTTSEPEITETNKEKSESKPKNTDNKGFWLKATILIAVVGVLSFGLTYFIRSRQIDDEFRQAAEWADKERETKEAETIIWYSLKYKDKEYTANNILELKDLDIQAGDRFEITVQYGDEQKHKQELDGYFAYADVKEPELMNVTGRFHINLPSEWNKN